MKRVMIAVSAVIFILAACGGSKISDQADLTSEEGTTIATSGLTVGLIDAESVDGTLTGRLVVTGSNFSAYPELQVFLVHEQGTLELAYSLNSDTELALQMPEGLPDGSYQLVFRTAAGDVSAPMFLLRGEQGEPGQDGLVLEAIIICPDTGDMIADDPDIISLRVAPTNVNRFGDDTYFISCTMILGDSTVPFEDSYTAAAFMLPANGIVTCNPGYGQVFYDVNANTVTYLNVQDPPSQVTLDCLTTYEAGQ